MSRPKDIGTAAETALVNYLKLSGWPLAERRALHGSHDKGDIAGCVGIVWEVKAGEQANKASDGLIHEWLEQTETERVNDNAEIGILVTRRFGHRAPSWWAWLPTWALLVALGDDDVALKNPDVPVRLLVSDLIALLHEGGWTGDEK